MDNDFKDIILFDDVSFGDVLKEVYTNTIESKNDLDHLIDELTEQMNGVNNITFIGPILNNYIDSRIKTNEQLLKFIAAMHKLIGMGMKSTSSGDELMSAEEKEQLMNDIKSNVSALQESKDKENGNV